MLAPQPDPTTNEVVLEQDFSSVLGLNRQSKYFEAGLKNRKKHNRFLKLTGDIETSESITCRGCNDGVLLAKGLDGSYTVKLFPFGTVYKYHFLSSAQLRRREPRMDEYEREQQLDNTPEHEKETIDTFFRRHVPILPNKRKLGS